MKYLLRKTYKAVSSTAGFLKKAIIVFVVLAGVIQLFTMAIVSDKRHAKVNPQKILEYNRTKIQNQLTEMKKDESLNGKIGYALRQGTYCSTIGEACSGSQNVDNQDFQNSILGKMTGWIATPYSQPPASGIAWLQEGLDNAGFIPSAHAALGTGFSSIHQYMTVWKVFRDFAYMLIVLFMLIIGFMIMFRAKLDAQTVIGVENALPRLVLALIMVTFSFAIAGFLIDIMYSIIAIFIGLIYDAGFFEYIKASQNAFGDLLETEGGWAKMTRAELLNSYLSAGFWQIWPEGTGGSWFGVGTSLWRLMPYSVQGAFQILIIPAGILTGEVLNIIPKTFLNAFSGISAAGFSAGNTTSLPGVILLMGIVSLLVTWGPGIFLGVVVLLTIVLFMFKIFFMLLESYIKILLYIIFAPVILMASIFPGNGAIGWWLKNLFGELMTFPVVIIITLVGNAVIAANIGDVDQPFLSFSALGPNYGGFERSFRLPFLYGFQTDDFNTIISLGIVLMIPDFVKLVKGWIGVSDSGLNFGVGTFLAGASIFTGAFSAGNSFQNLRSSFLGVDYNKPKGLLHSVGFGEWADTLAGRKKSP